MTQFRHAFRKLHSHFDEVKAQAKVQEALRKYQALTTMAKLSERHRLDKEAFLLWKVSILKAKSVEFGVEELQEVVLRPLRMAFVHLQAYERPPEEVKEESRSEETVLKLVFTKTFDETSEEQRRSNLRYSRSIDDEEDLATDGFS